VIDLASVVVVVIVFFGRFGRGGERNWDFMRFLAEGLGSSLGVFSLFETLLVCWGGRF